jgi:tetraacyldisaccharide 4'-kinase
MQNGLYFWIEEYLFYPKPSQKLLSLLLLPLTLIYCIIIFLKNFLLKPKDFGIPIISIGNLIVGGSGKTPLTIALAKDKKEVCVILRGYGRKSSGLVVVSKFGEIKCDLNSSGDEAMMLAKALPEALIIVSEDRKEAIKRAKEMDAKLIFLDDGYSKKDILKFDILIKPKLNQINPFCLPSGPYREPRSNYQKADLVLVEGEDFKREVKIENPTKNMIFITAISKPKRLDPYLPKNIQKFYFPDHYDFKEQEIRDLIQKSGANSILTTQKDAIKLERFGFELSILSLNLKINPQKTEIVDKFLEDFDKISQI